VKRKGFEDVGAPTNEKSVEDSFGGVGTSFSVESVASDVVEKDKSENAEVSSNKN
jgi:hypothetical protein